MKATLFALFVAGFLVGCGAQKVSYDNEEILELIGPISPAEFDRTKKLAEAGDMTTQVRLSLLYSVGAGVPQDHKEAFKWSLKAAEQGDAVAQYGVGVHYYVGQGVPEDDKESVKWYTKSAEQGLARAQYVLGERYYNGEGVVEDYVTSFAWCSVAQANGNKAARLLLKKLKIDMTKDQIAVGQALAKKIFERIENKDSDNPINQRVD